jgi:hypothetical protein
VAVAEAPPHVGLSLRPDPRRRPRHPARRGRHLVIRHVSGHQVVALVEIVSPSFSEKMNIPFWPVAYTVRKDRLITLEHGTLCFPPLFPVQTQDPLTPAR